MNKHFNTSDIVEETDNNTSGPVLATLIHDTPMGGTVEADGSVDEAGGTVATDGPMDQAIVHEAPVGESISHEAPISTNAGSSTALLDSEESEHLRTRWNEIQGKFVDEPRSAVQQADALVSEVIEKITQMFANEHRALESQWKQGNDVSTEDLRRALQRYRSFFNRLVV